MDYRPEWFPETKTNDSWILGIAMNVVGFIRGSYDTMVEDHYLNIRALEWVVENWDYMYDCGREGDVKFDFAVLKVINTALEMEEVDKKKRGY